MKKKFVIVTSVAVETIEVLGKPKVIGSVIPCLESFQNDLEKQLIEAGLKKYFGNVWELGSQDGEEYFAYCPTTNQSLKFVVTWANGEAFVSAPGNKPDMSAE